MTLEPTVNRCCGINLTLQAPASIQDWIEVLGEARCCELIFKMQCYSKANQEIRYALGYNPNDAQQTFSPTAIGRATERANQALLKP